MIRTTLSLVVALLFATTASQAQQQSNDPLAALLPAAAATQDNAPAPATPSAPVAATPAENILPVAAAQVPAAAPAPETVQQPVQAAPQTLPDDTQQYAPAPLPAEAVRPPVGKGQDRQVMLSEKPISLRLPRGREVIIKFPQALTQISVNDPDTANDFSQFLTPDGVLYLTAVAPFRTRMVAEMVDGRLILLDVEGAERGPFDGNLTITDPRTMPAQPVQQAAAPATPAPPAKNPYKPAFLEDGAAKTLNMAQGDLGGAQVVNAGSEYHQMVRYGFRHFVGPARLIGDDLGKPVKVGKGDVAASLLRMNDGRLTVKPLKQWAIGDHYLTVMLVNNRSAAAVEFDPRAMRGRWMFAAALYPVIEPRGSRFDQTLWALISDVPFDQARR